MFWLVFTLALIAIDQLTKFAAASLGWSIFLNDRFAFSLPVPIPLMFVIYAVVLAGITWYVSRTWRRFNKMQKYAWCFVYAGGLSNIVERVITGHVKDFIPVANGMLNAADFFILIGLLLLLASSRYRTTEPSESSPAL